MQPTPNRATDAFADMLLELGVVTASQVTDCRSPGGSDCTPLELLEKLVALGHLDREEAEELGRHLTPGDTLVQEPPPTRVLTHSRETPQPGAPPRADLPTGPNARFEILEEIGRGGMGVVYKAFDRSLARVIALKGLIAGPLGIPDQVAERFRREAHAAARLRHSGIIQVHEVQELHGQTYIVMDYIDGRGLGKYLESRPGDLREAARLVRDVAEAIAHAHAAGVIHRDLKPDNILVDAEGRAYVGDFGLARAVDAPETRLTASGAILGTPSYMAPEQAEGDPERVGPLADVYGLGAVLYEALTARPPFVGSGLPQVLYAVVHADPPPPTKLNPRVPRDLEMICLHCLEKEPARRYVSAKDLALDLGRFLAGEAILARPDRWWQRGLRWGRRRKAVVLLAGALVLATAGVIGSAIHARKVEQERAAMADHILQEMRKKSGQYLEFALNLRRGGGRIAEAERYLPQLQAAVAEALEADPQNPEPHYHLGRLHRALWDHPKARAAQDRALALDPDFAPSLYERTVLLARELGDRLVNVGTDWWSTEGSRLRDMGALEPGAFESNRPRLIPQRDELLRGDPEARRLQDVLLGDLRRLEKVVSTSGKGRPVVSPGQIQCARSLLGLETASTETEWQQVEDGLEDALTKDPTLEEAYHALSSIKLVRGDLAGAVQVIQRGLAHDAGYVPLWELLGLVRCREASFEAYRDTIAWERLLEQAEASFSRALEIDPDAISSWQNRGGVRSLRGQARIGRGQDPSAWFARAEQDLDVAVRMAPWFAPPLVERGFLHLRRALFQHHQGVDLEMAWQRAIGDLERAVALAPRSARAWLVRGAVWSNRMVALIDRRQDPEGAWREAELSFAKSLELDPTSMEAYECRGILQLNRVRGFRRMDEDPRPLHRTGEMDLTRVIECAPDRDSAWTSRGSLRLSLGKSQADAGEDPLKTYAAAEADFGEALELEPRNFEAWRGRALVHAEWSLFESRRGAQEGIAHWLRAESDFGESLKQNPGSSETWYQRGNARARRIFHATPPDRDPEDLYREADDDLSKALELNPAMTRAWVSRSWLLDLWLVYRIRQGRNPETMVASAEACYGEAIQRAPSDPDVWQGRGKMRWHVGMWQATGGHDPEAMFDRSRRDLERALEQGGTAAEIWYHLGLVHSGIAYWRANHGSDPLEEFAASDAALGKALARTPDWADALSRRGLNRYCWAEFLRQEGKEWTALSDAALADHSRALEIDPGRSVDRWQRAYVHMQRKRWSEAVADFSAAAEMAPASEPTFHAAFEAARAELAAANAAGS